MKAIKYIIGLMAAAPLFAACEDNDSTNGLSTRNTTHYTINEPYDYPIKPGTPEWADLKSGQEMYDVCQLPEDILKNISTEALVQTCLNFPLALDYTAFNDERAAIISMIERFNGLKELSTREDCIPCMIKAYGELDPDGGLYHQTTTRIATKLTFGFMELLFENKLFWDKLTKKELATLKQTVIDKYKAKGVDPDTGIMYSSQSLMLIASIELRAGTPFSKSVKDYLLDFIKNYRFADRKRMDNVIKLLSL